MASNLNISEKIREAIPEGMSITEAAKRLRVSRPALSKLLNGRADLSPKMAKKFKETFGADMTDLLKLQASAEPETKKEGHGAVPVNPSYVPSFLTITARQIEDWGTKCTRTIIRFFAERFVANIGVYRACESAIPRPVTLRPTFPFR